MFTLHLTVHGCAIEPTEHGSLVDMGDALAKGLCDAGTPLPPRMISVLLSLMFNDLRADLISRWAGEGYEIFVVRDGS